MPFSLSQTDLDHILTHTRECWAGVGGSRLLLTGGTGFLGRWLTESFLHANQALSLGAQLTILTRQPLVSREPGLAYLQGDVREFRLPDGDAFPYVIHGATDVLPAARDPRLRLELWDTIVGGTRRVLECAAQARTKRLLLLSSGAVYGTQPASLAHLPESFMGAPAIGELRFEYGEGKRAAEFLGRLMGEQHGFETVNARLFAVVGPHLPLEGGYALGNFLRDVLRGQPIQVAGDGTAVRSYLYAADLTIWLWRLLFQPTREAAYNVGSEQAVSIGELAALLSRLLGPVPIHVAAQPSVATNRYVPDTRCIREELGVREWVDLEQAIRRTAAWLRTRA